GSQRLFHQRLIDGLHVKQQVGDGVPGVDVQAGADHAAAGQVDQDARQRELLGDLVGEVDADGGGPAAAGHAGDGDDAAGGDGHRRAVADLEALQRGPEVFLV